MTKRVLVLLLAAFWVMPFVGDAAQTRDPIPTARTTIALKLASEGPIPFKARKDDGSSQILVEFPANRVLGSLPDQSVVNGGAIKQITTQYYSGEGRQGRRFIRSLAVDMTGPYRYRAWAEPGRVLLEIEHPASMSDKTLELGLPGGVVISSMGMPSFSARFHAMQEALQQASGATLRPFLAREQEKPVPPKPVESSEPAATSPARPAPHLALPFVFGMLAASAFMLLGLGLLTWLSWRMSERSIIPPTSLARLEGAASSMALVDELVWHAFERQGYRLIHIQDVFESSTRLRVAEKAASRVGLWCAGGGAFFEKQTVDRFAELMRLANVDEGFLIATGSFTVPAQRAAREQQITLIGREQLVGLLGIGAAGEYVQKQMEQANGQLDESKRQLRRYEDELETLRRQRNEASWHLGSERVKASNLETQISDLTAQIQQQSRDLDYWKSEAAALKKQWEESQWYLGEARSREEYLESQMAGLQEQLFGLSRTTKEREDIVGELQEEKSRVHGLEAELTGLRLAKTEAERIQQEASEAAQRYKRELHAVRFYGERRSAARGWVPDVFVELGAGEQTFFSGTPRDLSGTGMSLQFPPVSGHDGAFTVRLHLPGNQQPTILSAQQVWKVPQSTGETLAGFHFADVSEDVRAHLEHLIAKS